MDLQPLLPLLGGSDATHSKGTCGTSARVQTAATGSSDPTPEPPSTLVARKAGYGLVPPAESMDLQPLLPLLGGSDATHSKGTCGTSARVQTAATGSSDPTPEPPSTLAARKAGYGLVPPAESMDLQPLLPLLGGSDATHS